MKNEIREVLKDLKDLKDIEGFEDFRNDKNMKDSIKMLEQCSDKQIRSYAEILTSGVGIVLNSIYDTIENVIEEIEEILDEDTTDNTSTTPNKWIEVEVYTSGISTEKMPILKDNIIDFNIDSVGGSIRYFVLTKTNQKHQINERSYKKLVEVFFPKGE